MNQIKLNTLVLEVIDYNKSTYLDGDLISSNASCSVSTNDITALTALIDDQITSIRILHDNTVIYDLQNINAKITNINEYLSGDHMNITLSLIFDN